MRAAKAAFVFGVAIAVFSTIPVCYAAPYALSVGQIRGLCCKKIDETVSIPPPTTWWAPQRGYCDTNGIR
ncbi:b5 [miniopterid betaherpesvirus 1]|uniref:B5 n=1 Tax=miniopterid betaherpesvirus 1 TaxID=3070189 RepID=I3VPY6_9BETA|nr:b5 [miniopterid betaherpesvirus 1]AFK83830.1 b5 [miniopterid betaherpesvirus 1]